MIIITIIILYFIQIIYTDDFRSTGIPASILLIIQILLKIFLNHAL